MRHCKSAFSGPPERHMERAVDLFAAVEAFLEHAREEKYCHTAFDYLLDAAEALGEAKAHQFHSWDASGLEPMRLRAEKALRTTFSLVHAKCCQEQQ